MRSYFGLLSDPRFAVLSVGQMVSLLGDVMFPLVVLFAALQSGADAAQVAVLVGTVYAVRFTALAGVVLFSGGFLDRLNPVRSAAAADSLRVVALLALILWWDGGLGVLILLVAATVGGLRSRERTRDSGHRSQGCRARGRPAERGARRRSNRPA